MQRSDRIAGAARATGDRRGDRQSARTRQHTAASSAARSRRRPVCRFPAEPWMVPPCGVEACQRLHHAPAQRLVGRQRPLCGDLGVSVRSSSSRCPAGSRAPQAEDRSNAAPGLRASPTRPWRRRRPRARLHERPVIGTTGQGDLQDQRAGRRFGCALVSKLQSHDARHELVARRLGLDRDDAAVAQDAATLQGRREIGGISATPCAAGRSGQR